MLYEHVTTTPVVATHAQGSDTTVTPVVEVWQLERNPVAQSIVRARHIAATDRAVAGIPACGFERPVFWRADDEIVVDETVFSELRTVQARRAATFAPAGELVGRVAARGRDPLDIVKLLVHAGVIDATIHVAATVHVLAAGRDATGAWFRLASDARFWTDREHHERFEFGVRILDSGEIHVEK